MADFGGLRVLLVEDESLVAMMIEDMLLDLGCEVVQTAGTIPDAMRAIEQQRIELALLDINVAGKQVFPVAEALSEKALPFIFSSGYGQGGVPERFGRAPVVAKPFQINELDAAIRSAVGIAHNP